MIGKDDAIHTYEFSDHYVITPSISFASVMDFSVNAINEKGQKIQDEFEYSSDKNTLWLNEKGILEMIKHCD